MEEEEAEEETVYTFSIHKARARMRIEEDKYIVLQGSTAVSDNRDSALPAIVYMRQDLIDSGGFENGRMQWNNKGKNLNQMEAEALE